MVFANICNVLHCGSSSAFDLVIDIGGSHRFALVGIRCWCWVFVRFCRVCVINMFAVGALHFAGKAGGKRATHLAISDD